MRTIAPLRTARGYITHSEEGASNLRRSDVPSPVLVVNRHSPTIGGNGLEAHAPIEGATRASRMALVSCKPGVDPNPWNQEQYNTEVTASTTVELTGVMSTPRIDIDGRPMVPTDVNGDGVISGDIEMGS